MSKNWEERRKHIISTARALVNDPEGVVWSDDEMEWFLDVATEDYCRETGCFPMDVPMLYGADKAGVCRLPDMCAGFRTAYSRNGERVPKAGVDQAVASGLMGTEGGLPVMVVGDGCDDGEFIPVPTQKPRLLLTTGDYHGMDVSGRYGLVTQMYGIAYGIGHGVNSLMDFWDVDGYVVADAVFSPWQVPDHMALSLYMAHLALRGDSDFADEARSAGYLDAYRSRIGDFRTFMTAPGRLRGAGAFF